MTDENPRLAAIECGQSSLDQFSHLQHGGPHGSLTASNGSPSLSIVKQFVHDDGATQSEQSQFETSDLEETTVVFVDNVEIIDLILLSAEFLQDTHVLAGAPGGVDGDIERERLFEKEGQLGEDGFRMFFDGLFERVLGVGSGECSAHVLWNKRTVLDDVFECSTHRQSVHRATYFSFILSNDSSS